MSSPVPFPNGALEVFAEAAFGADIGGDQSAWVWTDLTPQDMDQTITTTRGRQDEASDVAPTQSGLELDNPTGALTPYNATSPYYPHVDLGTPGRWGIKTTTPRLLVNPSYGARAQVASAAALNITSDLDVRVDLHAKTIHPDAGFTVIAGRADDVGPYSWRLEFLPDRRVALLWSDDGTPTAPLFETSTVPVLPSSARTVLRATLDVNNGSGGYDVKFYLGESITGPWVQVGPTMTGAATTTVFNAGADLVVGTPPSLTAVEAMDSDVYHFQLRNGIDGPVVADADFTAQTPGVFTFVDSAGRTWDLFDDAEISNKWCRIFGTIDEWAPKWPYGDLSSQQDGGLGEGQARIDITINGILRRLGQGALPLQSALRRSIDDEPTRMAYWPMEDEKDSTQIASALPSGVPMLVGGGITFADSDELVGSRPLPKMGPTTFFSGAVSGVFTGEWQVDWYVRVPLASIGPGTWSIRRVTSTGTVRSWEVRVNAASVSVFGFNAAGGVVTTASSSPTDFFDRMVHIRLWARQNGTNVDWTLTWVQVTYPPSVDPSFSASYAGAVGQPTTVGFTPGTGVDGLVQGHIAVFAASNLDTTAGAAMGWMGETALERIDRLCHEELVSLRVIGSSVETPLMGPQRVATLLDLLDDAADVDGGILYEQQCSVGLVYRTRASLYNQPDNLVLDGIGHQIANPFEPIRDDQKVRNVITVERDGGSSSTVIDQASVDKHGAYTESVTLNLLLDSQTLDAAGWRLHQGTVEAMRYASVSTNLGDAPEIISPWLTVDVGAKVHVTGLPPQHPTNAVHLMIEGYSEPISPVTWDPKATCSPGSVWDVTELDGDWVSDEYLLRLETDGSIVADQATPTATTLQVTVTDGPRWVTTASEPAELPFDIDVAGERMTVTAIGSPAGGEEFVAAGDDDDTVSSTSFVAPSVNAVASSDLLISAWCSSATTGTYTIPGSMTGGTLTSGAVSSLRDAREVLGASGPTGTRTATFSAPDTWSAVSVAVHGASGTPTIAEYLSAASSPGDVFFSVEAEKGDVLLGIQSWEWDPGDNMSAPSGDDWMALASSSIAGVVTASRTRLWGKRVLRAGVQSVTFGVTPDGVADNHARLYLLRGVTGVTQAFTVVRSVNGVVKAQDVTNPVRLWFTPVLAR
jgi:hypothetical protein